MNARPSSSETSPPSESEGLSAHDGGWADGLLRPGLTSDGSTAAAAISARELLLASVIGTAVTLLFWWPLATGAGFIGGDVYNYFFPLKKYYAEGLSQNEIRFWHPGIGHGVSVLGESQTGVFYPAHLVAYRLLDLNTAYNVVFLVHYVLTFVFAFWLARALRLTLLAALLAAVVFVFGWFPPRACLEWSIITGCWMPLSVLAVIRWHETGRLRWAWTLILSTTVQLLAGHFQLAFVTVLTIGVIVCAQVMSARGLPDRIRPLRSLLFLAVGFCLAAPQLLPTWELKRSSQRSQAHFAESVAYGRVPPAYFMQLVAPFLVYADAEKFLAEAGGDSNIIEAHLYFGMLPLILVTAALVSGRFAPRWWMWLVLLAISVYLAGGWPIAALSSLPGFGYFRYPGRYGLIAQFAAAMLAGAAADRLFVCGQRIRATALTLILTITLLDLYWVGRQIQVVAMVKPPAISRIGASEVFARLTRFDRVMAIDGNTLAMSGAACVPPYLGMGPAWYYEVWNAMPDVFHGKTGPEPEVIGVLARMGVTHLLTEDGLPAGWPVTEIWRGYDPFLHPRWGRDPRQPLHLYRFDATWGRAYVLGDDGRPIPDSSARIVTLTPHAVTVEYRTPADGRLVVTELDDPSWSTSSDPLLVKTVERLRTTHVTAGAGKRTWTYTPYAFYQGCGLALAALLVFTIASIRGRSTP